MNYYPSNQMSADSPYDRKTKVLNKLIYGLFKKDILSENSTLRALYLVKSYTHCYTIVFEMDGDYRSDDILNWILISTVDKILQWWDITDSYNLDIEYVTRGRRPINKNYFDWMFNSYISNSSRGYSREGVDNFHPRFEKMCRWMYNNKYHEYQAAINRTYDPYRYQPNPQTQELIRQRAQYRGEGILSGEYNANMSVESRQQQIIERQRELIQGQMSLRWSDYETNNPCAEIELPNVTVKQRVSKLNKLLNKLKL
jgi:hypothetical protein